MSKLKIFTIFLLFVSCSNSTNSPVDILANDKIPIDLLIGFERTGCYAAANACPTYKLIIKADGSVLFDGIDVTKVKGKVEDKISEDKLRQLINEFQKASFFELENSYDYKNCPVTATDLPNANTSIQINGKEKSVHHYLGCYTKYPEVYPPKLFELENKIDEIVGTKRWVEK